MSNNGYKFRRHAKQPRTPDKQRPSVRPTKARQLVALWAKQHLARAGQAPLHFLTFCHDIELFARRPIGRERALDAWIAAITRLGRSQERGVLPGEMSARDAERLIALEGLSTWTAAEQINVLSEASALSVSHHANFEQPYFNTSESTQRVGSVLGALAFSLEAELGKGHG